jgi:ATP/maltotriose-dependent transcriptional regulator MalT
MRGPTLFTSDAFIGRERELALLRGRLAALARGSGGVVLIAGEPGIGKTRLAEEAAGLAGRCAVQVLWGRADDLEGAPAYWPWAQVVRSYVGDRDPAGIEQALDTDTSFLVQVAPGLLDRQDAARSTPLLEPAQARFQLFQAVAEFFQAAARHQPLMVVLDDLHWADPPSLHLVQFVARDLHATPLLLVGTYRDIEVRRGHPLAQVVTALARVPGSDRIDLRGLAEAEIERFVAEAAGRPAPASLVAALARQTEGNPFFLSEIVRLLGNEGRLEAWDAQPPAGRRLAIPESVRETVAHRLRGLSPGCREVLRAAAVIGRTFQAGVIERMLGENPGELGYVDALEEAERALVIGAVPGTPGSFQFAHELIREALYDEMPSTQRARLHKLAGETLESLYDAEAGLHAEELAGHFLQAARVGAVEKAIRYARLAGDQAMSVAAYEDATRHYGRAVELLDLGGAAAAGEASGAVARCEIVLALGEAQRAAGEIDEARTSFRRAAVLARALGMPHALARAALGFGGETPQGGRQDAELVGLLDEARAGLGREESGLHAMILARLAFELYAPDAIERSAALGRQALTMARAVGDPRAIAYVLGFEAITPWGAMTAEERLAIAVEILRLAPASGNPARALVVGYAWRTAGLLEQGDVAGAERAVAQCERMGTELRQVSLQALAAVYRAALTLNAGRLAEAEDLAQQALALGQRGGLANALQAFGAQLFVLRSFQGRLAELEGAIKGFIAQYPAMITWQCALAYLYVELDRLREARQELERLAAGGFTDLPRDYVWLTALSSLAEVAAAVEHEQHAATLYDLLLPLADRVAVAGPGYACLGPVARLLGGLATAQRRWPEAAAHYEAASALCERMGAQPWLVRTQADYASSLLVRGDRGMLDRASSLVAAAGARAQALGLAREAGRCRSLAERLRLVPTAIDGELRPGGDSRVVLSNRELEILRLLAAGQGNQEIADALVLSVRTVENHVARIYGKIGVRSRAEATAYAFRRGIV